MTKPATEKPLRRKSGSQSNSIAWVLLGAVGLGYLGVAFAAPQILPDLSGGRQHVAETTVLRVSADVDTLKTTLNKIESDIASLRADAASQANQTQVLSGQVSMLEDKIKTAEAPAPAATTTSDAGQTPAPGFGGLAANSDQPDAPAADTPAAPKVINAPRVGAPIETGSVNSGDKAISFGPAVVKPAAKPIGIQIATDSSIGGLRITWGALSQIHADQLANLKARYADIGTASNPNFGLIAGPVKSKAEAKKLCKELAAQSIACKVSEYKGEEL